ncbi:MAG: phosphoglycerate dehydrogenase [Hyphomicrobiales bacterium]|nr:phosphoglycerate dehydrogenase [Hyphomicrobiales bacterium]MDE2018553.1 phosphoglycerate dehydrogenase [Hyphomicrobiales bacterium]
MGGRRTGPDRRPRSPGLFRGLKRGTAKSRSNRENLSPKSVRGGNRRAGLATTARVVFDPAAARPPENRDLRIVFHGEDTAPFADGFAALLAGPAEIALLPAALSAEADRRTYAAAQVVVANRFGADVPAPRGLRLLHAPAAGTDGLRLDAVPPGAAVCNCFGHEGAIAEYVMAALLARCVPLADADARLRRGDWAYQSGDPARAHRELSEMTLGLCGFGHVGKAIAAGARAFGMRVVVANRTPPAASPLFDRAFGLDDPAFWSAADAIVVSLPLGDGTRGLVGAAALGAMRADAIILNVGRGPVIDEAALYEALRERRIGGAVIDTWYRYPSASEPGPLPSALPFHELTNVVMTPHMSGWTKGTIDRRRRLIARNVQRLAAGEDLENVILPKRG